jgi:electron-transferring-flavoprotein dehydrogenase
VGRLAADGHGLVQIWPGTPVSEPLFAGTTESGKPPGCASPIRAWTSTAHPADGFMPGMDVRAQLTVVGDGPVGAVGQALDERFGLPAGHARREWALGMKIRHRAARRHHARARHRLAHLRLSRAGDLRLPLRASRPAGLGRHLRSLVDGRSARTAYRYLQHYIQHPALWRHLKDGTLRSWGAKSLEESGKHGEPFLTGDGFARIGEGSGSTNMLTGSGVDEAWTTGVQLGEAVLELLRAGKPFTQENLAKTYETRAAQAGSSAARAGRERAQRLSSADSCAA